MDNIVDQNGTGILLPVPLGDEKVFRNQAMDDIVELLFRNPHEEFGVRQLRDITGHGAQSVDDAITLLTQVDVIRTRREGNRKLISINRARVRKPDDPILEIPQEEFRDPVRAFTERVEAEQGDELLGILLFGSVSRGGADRTSDIDIQVIVEDDLLQSRRVIQEVKRDVEESTFGGERYEFQVLVESVDTAEQYGEKLREVFSEAITLYATDRLAELRQVILDG